MAAYLKPFCTSSAAKRISNLAMPLQHESKARAVDKLAELNSNSGMAWRTCRSPAQAFLMAAFHRHSRLNLSASKLRNNRCGLSRTVGESLVVVHVSACSLRLLFWNSETEFLVAHQPAFGTRDFSIACYSKCSGGSPTAGGSTPGTQAADDDQEPMECIHLHGTCSNPIDANSRLAVI